MSSTTTYRTKRLCDSNLKDVKELYETVFGQRISLEVLRQKYDTRYLGVKHLTYLAYDREKPIAFYGALPQKFIHNGKDILAVHTCDSITLPEYQRQGLHQMLGLEAYDLMKQHNIKFAYAYHSENTLHSCKKLGWQVAYTMKGFSITTNRIPFGKAARKFKPLKSVFEGYALEILKPFEIDSSRFSNSNEGLFQEYSSQFFDYKTFTANTRVELGNTKFWLKISDRVCVGDVRFESESDLVDGINTLKLITNKLGLNEILFQVTPGTAIEQALSKHFPSFESWKVGYILFDKSLDIKRLQGNYGDLDTF